MSEFDQTLTVVDSKLVSSTTESQIRARSQNSQHFTHAFFVQKQIEQLFSSFTLAS